MNYKPHPKYVNVNTTRKCWVDNQLAYKCERGLQAQQVKTIIKNNFSLVTCTTRENAFRIKIKDKGNDKVEALTISWHFFYQKVKKNLDLQKKTRWKQNYDNVCMTGFDRIKNSRWTTLICSLLL